MVTNMVRKDVLRTDRQHKFYSGENNENINALYNILTTFALHHPSVGYCQVILFILFFLLFLTASRHSQYTVQGITFLSMPFTQFSYISNI